MPKNWKTYKLGDLCTRITDGAHRSPKSVGVEGFPMASVKDLSSFGIQVESARRISKKEFYDLVKQGCKPEVGDVLIAKDGNTALDTVCVQKEEQNIVLLSSVAILRPNKKKIESDYLKYYFSDPRVIRYLKSSFISGAAIPRVVLRDFKLAEIKLPPLQEQKAIASILSALDDKIELNLQQNKILEEMAMALYKHWFVDFGPFQDGEFVESELGMIPKGWKVVDLNQIARVINGRAYKNVEFLDHGTPIIRIQNLKGGGKTVYSDLELSHDKYVDSGDLIYAWSATFGPYIWHGPRSIYHYHIWKLETNSEIMSKYYLFHHLDKVSAQMKEHGTGSIFTHLTKGTMESQKLILPLKKTMDEFHSLMKTYHKLILSNKDENQTLTSLRDTLLPKLISGEIRVKDVQDQLKSVL
ncbi:MAG: restriction endonuclease subunit S [Flavobacteriales bacterium]|nr:restriction endonuclease subunit S [Flavobacteriales bacterium]